MRRAIILLLAALAAVSALAQQPGITREQADAILNELKQIRVLLERAVRPAQPPEQPQKTSLKIEKANWLGAKDAPLTMVEYTDYQCSFCLRFHTATFPQIKKKYIDTGKLRFLSRDLPLDFHANAFPAAEAARCAEEQNKFWEMRDVLVLNANKLGREDILGYARGLSLDPAAFQKCFDSGRHRAAVQKDVAEAAALNIGGTPTFIVGRSTPEGVDGVLVVGAQPLAAFEEALRQFDNR